MAIFTVEYKYDSTRATEMDELRPKHREFLGGLHEQGPVKLVGSWPAPNPGAYAFIEAEDGQAALDLLNDDPFRKAGLIVERTVHPFNPVFGQLG